MKPQNIVAIHEVAVASAKRYLLAEFDRIEIIEQVDRNQVFLHYGCESLFAYVRKYLKLSESVAANFVTVARTSARIPALKAALQSRGLPASHVLKIRVVDAFTTLCTGHHRLRHFRHA